jgi:hypothetical protein
MVWEKRGMLDTNEGIEGKVSRLTLQNKSYPK